MGVVVVTSSELIDLNGVRHIREWEGPVAADEPGWHTLFDEHEAVQ